MRRQLVAAVLLAGPPAVPPPGVSRTAYRRALAEDVYEALHALANVTAALVAAAPGAAALAAELAWPGTPVVALADDHPAPVPAAFAALAAAGADLGVVVAPDAPDLPGLVVGKLFGALEDAPAAVCPAAGGGLVGLAARLPAPGWLAALPDLDVPDAVAALHAAAPYRSVVVGPGWHRLRAPEDVARLDPGLEGWEATRALLSGRAVD